MPPSDVPMTSIDSGIVTPETDEIVSARTPGTCTRESSSTTDSSVAMTGALSTSCQRTRPPSGESCAALQE